MSDADQPRLDERRPRGRRSLAFDVALALLAVGVGLVEIGDGPGVSAVLLTVVGGGALALRRLAPLVVLATTLVAATAMVAIDAEFSDPIEAAGLTVLIAVYTVGAMCERRVSLTALVPAAAVVAVLSASTADVEGRETSALGGAMIATALTVGIWGLGAYAQTRRHYLRELEERAVQAEREREQLARIAVHEERASIARELHDIVAHSVSVMLVGVRGARDVLQTAPTVADDTLARVERSGEQSLAELRRILALLRDRENGAESRPQPSLADLDELVADYRAAGLPVRLELIGEPQSLPGGVELSVYRIVQEALTNVLKHSDPTSVTVTLSFRDSALEVEVVDDGTSAALDAATTGQGIIGMRERLIEAIRVVHSGEALLSPSITRRLIEDFAARTDPLEPPAAVLERLTPREREVLVLVARGFSNSEIAQRLVVTEATVKSHVGSFLMKLGLRDRVQAVVFAYEHGIVTAGDAG